MTELALAPADISIEQITLADYQEYVAVGCFYDDPDKQIIKGMPAMHHYLKGVYEEYAETLEFDAEPPAYSRIGMIALHPDRADVLQAYRQDIESLDLHRKEFGDLLWYSTAFLTRLGISLPEATGNTGPHAVATFADFDRRASLLYDTEDPLSQYRNGFRNFARSAAGMLDAPTSSLREQTVSGAGMLLGAISWIAQDRLDTTLADIAVANMRKLDTRITNGTLFGVGDKR